MRRTDHPAAGRWPTEVPEVWVRRAREGWLPGRSAADGPPTPAKAGRESLGVSRGELRPASQRSGRSLGGAGQTAASPT